MLFNLGLRAKQGATVWAGVTCRWTGDRRSFTRALISAPADGLLRSMQADIERVLFDEPAIHKRLDQMAAQITADYRDRELTVIAVLTGSLMFMSDLVRRIPLRLKLDCLSVVSYHGKAQTSATVTFKDIGLPDVAGRVSWYSMTFSTRATRWPPFAKSWKRPLHAAFGCVCC